MIKNNLFIEFIKEDICNLLINIFDELGTNKYYIRKGAFFSLFIYHYPLKYQKNDKLIISSSDILNIVKEMNVCSVFKFRKKKVKRYKFLRSKVKEYERKMCI